MARFERFGKARPRSGRGKRSKRRVEFTFSQVNF
jgi:hypothetical protein